MNRLDLSNKISMPVCAFGGSELRTSKELDCAIKLGYRFFDSAYMYKTEEIIGKAVNKSINEGSLNREDFFIQSKVPHYKGGYNHTLESFNESLNKFNLDYLDSYLIHYPQRNSENWKDAVIDTWRALEKLYKEGKVKTIGVSNFLEHHLDFLLDKAEIKPMFNQIEVSPLRPQNDLVDYCKKNNIIVQAWSPFGAGRVFNEPLMKDLSIKYKTTITKLTLQWHYQNSLIPICGLYSLEEFEDVIGSRNFTIDPSDMNLIESLNYGCHTHAHSDGEFLNWVTKNPMKDRTQPEDSFVPSTWSFNLLGVIPLFKVTAPNQSQKSYYIFNIYIGKSIRKICENNKTRWSKKEKKSGKYDIEFVFGADNKFLEGPVWDAKKQVMYCTAPFDGEFYQVNPKTKKFNVYKTGAEVTGSLMVEDDNSLIVAHTGGLHRYNLKDNKVTLLSNPLSVSDQYSDLTSRHFNDGKPDAKGRFIVGTSGRFNNGKLYSFDGAKIKVLEENIGCSNGIAFSSDNKYMYYIDSYVNKVARYNYDLETGDIKFDKFVITIEDDGIADGMCMDLDGNLWVAEYTGKRVCKYNPSTGEKLEQVNLPVYASSCALGGENLDYLYITTRKPIGSAKKSGLCRIRLR